MDVARWLLLIPITCTTPPAEHHRSAPRDKALCAPWPTDREFRGQPTHLWSPQCIDDELPVACDLGVERAPGGHSCACKTDGDCRAAASSVEALSTTYAPLPSQCDAGRCVWAVGP